MIHRLTVKLIGQLILVDKENMEDVKEEDDDE